MAQSHSFDLIGVGNPIMDLIAHVTENFLAQYVAGDKGGMVLVDENDIATLVRALGGEYATAPGGSAANTILSAAQLGLRTTYVGKIGGDPTAAQYVEHFAATTADVARFKRATVPNGRCLSMVTADGQRTMRTSLGAAMTLHPDEISPDDFRGARHAHIEGYLLFNPALADKVVSSARAAGCTLSIDLASFEVVKAARDWIFAQLRTGVDIVFANEDEAAALFQRTDDYATFARELAGFGGIAAVKMGKDGAWIARRGELHRVAAIPVRQVIDTTGAGDLWAGGFLFGHLRGAPLPAAGAIGSLLGGECVQHLGAALPSVHWPRLRAQVDGLLR